MTESIEVLARPERFELPTAWFVAGYALRRFSKIFRTLRRANVPFVFRDSPRKCLSGRYAPRLSGTAKRAFPSLLLALSLPAPAATLYLHTGLAKDLSPLWTQNLQWQCQGNDCRLSDARHRIFAGNPMFEAAVGVREGIFDLSLRHMCSAEDGVNGAGLTVLSAGLTFQWEVGR